jgi:hypothetical protein
MASERSHQLGLTSASTDLEYWTERKGQCSIQYVDMPEILGEWGIPRSDIVPISQAARFLESAPSPDQNKEASELLESLKIISPTIARDHELKAVALQRLQLRLIQPSEDLIWVGQHQRSYIALSYRWPQSQTPPSGVTTPTSPEQVARAVEEQGYSHNIHTNRPHMSLDTTSTEMAAVPVPPILYRALLNERISRNEGLWVDQLCINQDDETEKSIAIPAMDLIYSRARMVVVVLGDICINQAEIEVLRDIVQIYEDSGSLIEPNELMELLPPFTEQQLENGLVDLPLPSGASSRIRQRLPDDLPALNSLLHKILSAEWFKRAWCNHEFRMSRRHIFLIRAEYVTQPRVVRFTGSFLYHLLSLSDMADLNYDKFLIKSTTLSYLIRLDWAARGYLPVQKTVGERWLRAYTNIFPLGAGGDRTSANPAQDAARDKYNIVLNTVGKGIYYKGSALSEENFCRNLITIALAAKDPTALCTTGQRVCLGQRWSWIQQPIDTDFQGLTMQTLHEHPQMPAPKIALDPSNESRWISLDLSTIHDEPFTETSGELTRAPRALKWAETFIDTCIELNIELIKDSGRFAKMMDTPSFPGISMATLAAVNLATSLRSLSILTLGGCVILGKEWITRAYVPLETSEFNPEGREAVSSSLDDFGLDDTVGETRTRLREPNGRTAAERILELVSTIVMAGVPFGSIFHNNLPAISAGSPAVWNPMVWNPMFIAPPAGPKLLVYVPRDLFNPEDPNLVIGIPTALLSDVYRDLNRVWVLRKHEEDGLQCWRLVGKTRLLGDVIGLSKESPFLKNSPDQRVYGPIGPGLGY